jgi:hypothetical protein
MPFWEKKQGRATVWDEVFALARSSIDQADLPPPLKDSLVSIVVGGVVAAAAAFEECQWFKEHKPLNLERAAAFVEVFAMAMVSRWVRNLCDGDETLDGPAVWAHLSSDILDLFGGQSAARYEEAWLVDMQFNQDRTSFVQAQKVRFAERNLVLCLPARALGTPLSFRLTSPPIPVEDTEAFVDAGYPLPPSGVDALVVFEILSRGAISMFQTYKGLHKNQS